MNPRLHAIRIGLQRGWTEFTLSIKSPQDQGFFVFMTLITMLYLYLNRDTKVEGTDLFVPAVVLPSILGAMVAFGLVVGPAYALAMEKEDGTLLRVRSAPYGLNGYVSGQVLGQSLGLIPSFVLLLVPGALLFGPVMHQGAEGWVTVVWVTVLGLLASMPIGIAIGSLAPNVQKVGTWGMLPVLFLLAISGIFYPLQDLWGWLQVVAQLFPIYWLGLGMRSAFLPESAAALEIAGSWRTLETVLVLGAWAVVGLSLTPGLLRRMARRQSGSQVAAARDEAVQWVR